MHDLEFEELSQNSSNLERERSGPPIHLWRLPKGDTEWMDEVYNECYNFDMGRKGPNHRSTFEMVLTNIADITAPMIVHLDHHHYTAMEDRPAHVSPKTISDVCRKLVSAGYVTLEKGYSRNDKSTEPTLVTKKMKLRNVTPPYFKSYIPKQGTIVCKGFQRPDELPEEITFRMQVIHTHNQMHGPDHSLRAVFTNDFQHNGRLYGDSVQCMRKHDRQHVLIDGEPTVEIDVRNCQPFLFHALHLGRPLDGDIYKVDDVPRDLMKYAYTMSLNCKSKKEARQALQGKINGKPEWKGQKAKELFTIVEHQFSGACDKLYCCEGLKLMDVEAGCMTKLLHTLNALLIKRHPIHDGIRIKTSDLDTVLPLMYEAFTVNTFSPGMSVEYSNGETHEYHR